MNTQGYKTIPANFFYIVCTIATLASFGACYMSYNAGMEDGFKKGVSEERMRWITASEQEPFMRQTSDYGFYHIKKWKPEK